MLALLPLWLDCFTKSENVGAPSSCLNIVRLSPWCAEEGLSPHTRRVIGVALKRRSRLLPQRGGEHLPCRPGMERVGRSDVAGALSGAAGMSLWIQAHILPQNTRHTCFSTNLRRSLWPLGKSAVCHRRWRRKGRSSGSVQEVRSMDAAAVDAAAPSCSAAPLAHADAYAIHGS